MEYISAAGGFRFFRDDVGDQRNDTYKISIIEASGSGGNSSTLEASANISVLEVWSHVCFTFIGDSSTGLLFYKDGVQNYSATTVNVSNMGDPSDTLEIGIEDVSTRPFDGKMSESAIFDDVLTSTEINDIMDNGLKPSVAVAGAKGMMTTRSSYWGD